MPSKELNDKLQITMRKVEALGKQYVAQKEVNQLRIDNEFLRVAHSVPSNPELVAKYKKQVAKMVRDIDRCIKQLNA